MQDRFKFRAWDKSKNRYLDDTSLEERLYHNATELLGACLALNDGNVNYDYTFEQCTGVKDKNGNLIYEGDIVDVIPPNEWSAFDEYNHSDLLGKKAVVEDKGAFLLENSDVEDRFWLCWAIKNASVEIVGNIHENPELLEE